MTAVIALENLCVELGGRPVLRDLTIALAGRSLGLLGPNGAGKTTLIRTLLGFHAPSRGTARLAGMDIRTHGKELRAIVGYMPENDAFIAGMSAVRMVRMLAEMSGLPPVAALERTHEVLYYVGLGETRYRNLEGYSLGMKQLAKLAQAIVHAPRVLLLDEPTNGLDPPARRRMIKLIQEIRDAGEVHIVFSSHLLRDVEECCDEVMVLKDGAIVRHCDLAAERQADRRFVDLELRGDREAFAARLQQAGYDTANAGKHGLKVVCPGGLEMLELYRLADAGGVQIRRLSYKRDSLQDIFLEAMEATDGRV
ncbi:MAG: ABC transporter ATP-binding protein [Candidatus Schekmanbacteria bacterium]|nr:ABC transporter ATP-binding protein [Candidatus Schekmanbacteria bacterium]